MTDRFPLIANPTTKQIEELASGDNLNLQNSGIVGATTITANKFVGDLQGNAETATTLNNAENITTGTINSSRLSGYYGISVNDANTLNNAANITTGTISSSRLSGSYGIDVTGTATTAINLADAANITTGTIDSSRLSGTYDINVSYAGTASNLLPGLYAIDVSGNAATATTATNLSGGTITGVNLNIFGDSNLGITTVTNLRVTNTATIGYSTITSASIGIGTVRFLTATNLNVSGISTVGFITASNISSPSATVGIVTATTVNVTNAGISSLTVDYIKGLQITSLDRINTGIASVGFATIANANIGIATIGQINISSGIITASSFFGNLTGTATTATNLADAANITTGIINPSRLSGTYDIDVTGTATTATNLADAANITTGIINPSRLSGTYDISITGDSQASVAVTAINVSGGIASVTNLRAIGITTLGITSISNLTVSGISTLGITSISNLTVSGISTLGVTNVNELNSVGIVTASLFSGSGINLVGIVTQLTIGTGLTLTSSQALGKGTVQVGIKTSIGKTIYVSFGGSDTNTGLVESDAKRTIKAAAALALPGDTIKVFPGTFVENNPITLARNVSVQGTELRNCIVTPQDPSKDLFYVNDGCHMTNLSFNGSPSTNGAAVVSFVPLSGIATDRFFDAARMIRLNLDFIASETVGYLTSTDYRNPPFTIGISTIRNCKEDIISVFKAVCYDITRGGNSKCVGAGKSYYTEGGALQHIVGVKTETIDAFNYAAGIARSCINNVSFAKTSGGNYQTYYTQVKDLSMQPDGAYGNENINSCSNVVSAIYSCVGVVTTIINQGLSVLGVGINTTYPGNSGLGTSVENDPSFSPGVGNILKGPYIRNCTNFIPNSIGLKVDGFSAEPGDQDDIGVTGSMSVDSYTQYNQGGIGVSITNGGYAQLVSIFTICDDIAIYTAGGGQCDITNSNSSFGNYGLYSVGVGDNTTKSIYRYTGTATTEAAARSNVVTISGVGTNRPYDGQSCYFGTLYYNVNEIQVNDGGSGYTGQPTVTISSPTGPNGVTAQAVAIVENGSITAINVLNSGSQYLNSGVTVTIAGPSGAGTTATASVSNYQPIYYKVSSATLPSSGISTVTFLQTLNNTVSAGTTVYFVRGSLQIASTISFEYVGAGTNIFTAKPSLGGVVIPENKVIQLDGGTVTYTSTDQTGNFNIGDGIVINQTTGQISGADFTKALFTTMTPFILALSD